MDLLYDFFVSNVDVNGNFLLCTDGVYEFFEEDGEDFLDILLLKDLEEVKKAFKTMIKGDNSDDATYILVEI